MRTWPVFAVVVVAGACAAPVQRATPKKASTEVVFSFEVGPCPGYTVEIFEDLGARFTGSRYTHERGSAWFKITPEQLEALRSVKMPYWPKRLLSGGCGYDVSRCLRVERKWDTKWVSLCICEEQIGGYEAELLSLTGVGGWAAIDRDCPDFGGAAGR